MGRPSDSDPKAEGWNPVRSTRTLCEFFPVKNGELTGCRYAQARGCNCVDVSVLVNACDPCECGVLRQFATL